MASEVKPTRVYTPRLSKCEAAKLAYEGGLYRDHNGIVHNLCAVQPHELATAIRSQHTCLLWFDPLRGRGWTPRDGQQVQLHLRRADETVSEAESETRHHIGSLRYYSPKSAACGQHLLKFGDKPTLRCDDKGFYHFWEFGQKERRLEPAHFTEHLTGDVTVRVPGGNKHHFFFYNDIVRTINWQGTAKLDLDKPVLTGDWAVPRTYRDKSFEGRRHITNNAPTPGTYVIMEGMRVVREKIGDSTISYEYSQRGDAVKDAARLAHAGTRNAIRYDVMYVTASACARTEPQVFVTDARGREEVQP